MSAFGGHTRRSSLENAQRSVRASAAVAPVETFRHGIGYHLENHAGTTMLRPAILPEWRTLGRMKTRRSGDGCGTEKRIPG
jgi:hypothetical protein